MKERAILSLLWQKNRHVLQNYLLDRPSSVLTLVSYASDDFRQTLASTVRAKVYALEGMLDETQRTRARRTAQDMASAHGEYLTSPVWQEFCNQRGLEIDRFGTLVGKQLVDRIYEQILLVDALDIAAERFDIELLVVNEDMTRHNRTMVDWAVRHGVPSLHLAHGALLARPYTVHGALNADVLAVFGEHAAHAYHDIGVPMERIRLTGNPAWDVYSAGLSDKREELRHGLAAKYGWDRAAPIVVFGTTWVAYLTATCQTDIYEETLQVFLRAGKALRDSGLKPVLVIKDRPPNATFGRETTDRLATALGLQKGEYFHVTADTESLVVVADVMVSVDSNLLIEAMMVGVPAINLLNEPGLRIGPSFYADSGILEVPAEELADTITAVLSDPKSRADLKELMAARVTHYNVGVDGKAGERVAQVMLEMLRDAGKEVTLAEQDRPQQADESPPTPPLLQQPWKRLNDLEGEELLGVYHDSRRKELPAMLARPPRRVLDIGCATGSTGMMIKEQWPGTYVAGIELNKRAAEKASERIDLVISEKLEDIDLEAAGIAPDSIDTVILADVLEHMYDPWSTLLRLHPYLTDDAQVLVSIPNVRNLNLLGQIVNGHFPYANEGLLDITHIRFFTLQEMEKMLRETGYEVYKLGQTWDASIEHLKYDPKRPSIDTDKFTLKNLTEREFNEYKTIQFLLLSRPVRPLPPDILKEVQLRSGPRLASASAQTTEEEEQKAPDNEELYPIWRATHVWQEKHAAWLAERMDGWAVKQKLHIAVILPSGAEAALMTTIKSLSRQLYMSWRLSIVSGCAAPEGLAGGELIDWVHAAPDALLAAANKQLVDVKADWVGMCEAGDELAIHATFAFNDAINRHPDKRAWYSDEDSLAEDGSHSNAFFKPDFDLDWLRTAPYSLGGLLVLERGLFAELGGFRPEVEGAEYWDLALRTWEHIGADGIGHVADVLYHRFVDGGHCRRDGETVELARLQVLEQHLQRSGLKAELYDGALPSTYRIRYLHDAKPLVSIIIPTKNLLDMLHRCIGSVLENTAWPNYEILVVDNGSDDRATLDFLAELRADDSGRFRVLEYNKPFNFSAMNNLAVREARGEYLLLLNNDTAALEPEWLDEMMGYAQRPDVGAVGARLIHPDGRLQHVGVYLGIGGEPAGHIIPNHDGSDPGYFGRAMSPQDLSAVTAACLLIRKDMYEDVGGMDEKDFAVSFNDVDLCLKVREKGKLVVYTPYATLLHDESVSQNSTLEGKTISEKAKRFSGEREAMFHKWGKQIAFDPAYNRNLSFADRECRIEVAHVLTLDPEWRPRPRILAHPADRYGCGEYRIIAPMRALNHAGMVQGLETGIYFAVPEIHRFEPDSIVLQRQIELGQVDYLQERYVQHSKAFRVFELDDLLTNVPVKSARKKIFVEMKDMHKRFRKAAGLCHRFVVSTEYLAEAYQGYADEVVTVHNYIERARWGHLKPLRRQGKKPRVGWAGGITHDGDLEVIADVVKGTANEVDWIFMGMCPEALRPYVKEYHSPVVLDKYPEKLASLNLDLAVAPLEDVPFNHGKSHLRLLEYGILGFPVICTDITPYKGDYPVTRVASRYKDWVEAIRSHVADMDALAKMGDELRRYIEANWMLEDHLDVWLRAWLP